jgi:hypothetical protein
MGTNSRPSESPDPTLKGLQV